MLSLILIDNQHTDTLEKFCHQELRGEEYEIVRADSWFEGFNQVKGDVVTFLEPTFDLSDNYFHDLLDTFLEQPSFRKMAMVASPTANREWLPNKKVYGYLVSPTSVLPSNIKSSSRPYTIQIGYIPGAVLRKVVLDNVINEDFGSDILMDSINLSLHFWQHGLRCILNPQTTYYTSMVNIDIPIKVIDGLPEDIGELMLMFRRELIG